MKNKKYWNFRRETKSNKLKWHDIKDGDLFEHVSTGIVWELHKTEDNFYLENNNGHKRTLTVTILSRNYKRLDL